ncbi:MAG: hypothetical protein JWO38_7536 [Gemmataceae bacterium]|nr:hypothetical protein [Gemmataceae bacterium]
MSYRNGLLTGFVVSLLASGVAGAAWWLVGKPGGDAKPPPPAIPATVSKPLKEDQIAITLTPEAEARLAIRTGTVERKPMKRMRVYGGETVVPPGRAVIVSAPLAGTLKPNPGITPAPGLVVKRGQPVFQFLPLLDPVGRANLTATSVEAEAQVQNAEEQLKAANIALDRAKRLFKGEAGSGRMVDEAQAQVDIAAKARDGAVSRRNLLNKLVGDIEGGTTAPLPVEAPADGLIRTMSALPGQTVPAGAALFEVVNLDRVWVRVPVYVGDLPEVDAAAPAAIGGLTNRPGGTTHPATPVAAPPAANPTAGTADLYYELDNRGTAYRPGERVGVTLPLRDEATSLTAPWAAVVFDINGGAWVYERTGERTYARRRVSVRYVHGGTAVLAAGPAPGTAVVTAGAAELFGTDAGFSK